MSTTILPDQADPYAAYARMRASEPVGRVRTPQGREFWLVTRYEDVAAALMDPRLVRDPRNAGKTEEGDALGPHLLNSDPPDHTRLRALVRTAFAPRLVERLRPGIQRTADDLLDGVAGKGSMDLIGDYAFPLPITVITELLGVPSADRDRFRIWSDRILETDSTLTPEAFEQRWRSAMAALYGYLRALFDEKRARPADDLVSGLLQVEESGHALSERELLAMVWLLLAAGHQTTVNLIGNGMLALLTRPDQLAHLNSDPSLISQAVEELLRYDCPAETSGPLLASQDMELAGQRIAKGDEVFVALGSANRDEAHFAHADQLDITRPSNPHLAFGKGFHFCVGASLARLEGQIAIATLVRRLPRLRLAVPVEELEWRSSLILRGLRALPVGFS